MGVDIPNIRWIVHYMVSESIEDYYQEIGRGGRDGDIAKTVLLYVEDYDYVRRAQLIRGQLLKPAIVSVLWRLMTDVSNLSNTRTVLIPSTLVRARLFNIVRRLYGENRSAGKIGELWKS